MPRSRSLLAYEGARQAYGVCLEYDDFLGRFEACYDPTVGLTKKLTEDFFSSLDKLVRTLDPVNKRLDEAGEHLLARYCLILGAFDYIARGGVKDAPVFLLNPARRPLPDLLASVEDCLVDDLSALSYGFYKTCGELIAQSLLIHLNPLFDGSNDVGGADADIIADGCLIDIKTTTKPQIKPQWLYQLLGYALLDYNNRYNIKSVGIYMSRQQCLKRWDIPYLLTEMSGGCIADVDEARSRFQGEIAYSKNSRS